MAKGSKKPKKVPEDPPPRTRRIPIRVAKPPPATDGEGGTAGQTPAELPPDPENQGRERLGGQARPDPKATGDQAAGESEAPDTLGSLFKGLMDMAQSIGQELERPLRESAQEVLEKTAAVRGKIGQRIEELKAGARELLRELRVSADRATEEEAKKPSDK